MEWYEYLIVGLLAISATNLTVQTVLARRDQKRAARAGEKVGSLWHHMMRLHHEREAKRKAQRQAPRKPGDTLKPSRTSFTSTKTTRAIRTGWSIGEVEFTYRDVDGVVTRRRVTVHSLTQTYLKGECHDRGAERTFRLDRIIGDLVDCQTGELVSPSDLVLRTH